MKSDEFADIDIRKAVAIGEAEALLIPDIVCHSLEPPACHGLIARINECHPPRLNLSLMDDDFALCHIEGHVRHVQGIVAEVFLDHVALVTTADDEIIHTMS